MFFFFFNFRIIKNLISSYNPIKIISPATIAPSVIQTTGLNTAISASDAIPNRLGSAHTAVAINPAESKTIIARYQLNGIQSQIKFINPEIINAKIGKVVLSRAVNPLIANKLTRTPIKSIIARGRDFFKTCGMKLPLIFLSFGSNVSINGGTPITNISRINIFLGEKG